MLRSPRFRAFTVLLGLWFLVAGQEPPFSHPCEMGASAVAQAGHAEHAEHSDHSEHGAPEHAPDACECVDCCTPVSVAAPLDAAIAAAVTTPVLRGPIAATAARTADVAPRLLPFANGPPATLS